MSTPEALPCPTCGSDSNEQDELIKAEREIERLTAERDALREALQAAYDALRISYPLHSCDMDKRGAVLSQARAALAAAPAPAPHLVLLTDEQILCCFDDAVSDYVDVSDDEMVSFGRAVMRRMIELARPHPAAPAPHPDTADAERYRWLREHGDRGCTEKDGYGGQTLRMGEDLDAAIDAARAQAQGGKP